MVVSWLQSGTRRALHDRQWLAVLTKKGEGLELADGALEMASACTASSEPFSVLH